MHEQNSLPGVANRLGARFAKRVAVSFPGTPMRHAEYVGLPIRTLISSLDRHAVRAEARAFFGLDPDLPTLVVTGGSQGAQSLNRAVAGAARALGEAGVQVLHVVGPKNDVTPQEGVPTYVPVGFVDRMDFALAAADLMVCRGGRLVGDRGRRGRRPGGLRAAAVRQRRAGHEPRSPSWTPGERCWSRTPRSP